MKKRILISFMVAAVNLGLISDIWAFYSLNLKCPKSISKSKYSSFTKAGQCRYPANTVFCDAKMIRSNRSDCLRCIEVYVGGSKIARLSCRVIGKNKRCAGIITCPK